MAYLKLLLSHLHGNFEENIKSPVRFDVLRAVIMKSTIFWDMTPFSPLSSNLRFGGTYRLYLQSQKNKLRKKPAIKQVASP
jgi:hypothetical protein